MISPAGLASPLLLLVGYVGMADGQRETETLDAIFYSGFQFLLCGWIRQTVSLRL